MNWDWDKLKEQQHKQSTGISPPQVDELLNRFKAMKLPGGPIVFAIFIILFLIYSAIFTIQADEVGVIQRFGVFKRIAQPGLNFKLPAGIEKVTKVKDKKVFKEEFGFRSTKDNERPFFPSQTENDDVSLMLTGDLNVAVVPWIVQYRISHPYNFLFKVDEVLMILRDMSEATMRQVVGDRSINEIISKRDEIAVEAKMLLQKELDQAETGIKIVTIEMQKTNVPEPVQPSFNEVNQATQVKEQMIYQAREDYNKAIPAARGEAERTLKAAEGYALERINKAKGDGARFTALYGEYTKARDVTQRRMYLEMIRDVFPKLGNKYIVDSEQKNLLPLLNIGPKQLEQQAIGTEK